MHSSRRFSEECHQRLQYDNLHRWVTEIGRGCDLKATKRRRRMAHFAGKAGTYETIWQRLTVKGGIQYESDGTS